MSNPSPQSLPPARPQLKFARYECKYLLGPSKVAMIRRLIGPHVQPDPYSARAPGGYYGVSSIYLDDARMRLYSETLDGLRDRYKLRVRAYADGLDQPVFCEVKRRRDRKIYKDRARLERAELPRLLSGAVLGTTDLAAAEQRYLESFRSKMDFIGATPKALVRYEREAFVGRFDPNLRITFDRCLRTRLAGADSNFYEGSGWHEVEMGRTVVELKFNERCPDWVARMIRQVGMRRQSYSKYAHSVAVLMRHGSALQFATGT